MWDDKEFCAVHDALCSPHVESLRSPSSRNESRILCAGPPSMSKGMTPFKVAAPEERAQGTGGRRSQRWIPRDGASGLL